MSRILLINSNRFKQPWPVIPFGLCYVASALEKAGHLIRFLDLCFSNHPANDIDSAVKVFNPDIVGVTVRNIDNACGYNPDFLVEKVKNEIIIPCKNVFNGPIIIGGPAAGINGAELLDFFDLEYAVRGDGETVITEFARRWQEHQPLEGLGGLIIRREGRIVQDPPSLCVEQLDELAFPKPYRFIDIQRYRQTNSPLQVQTKRGCALKCVYCTYNGIEGRYYRLRDPRRVAQEIEDLVKETGIKHIEFTDSVFNLPIEHAKLILQEVIRLNLNLKLRTMGINPGGIDAELVDLMQQAGFADIDLGAEAGSDVTLKGLGKSFSVADIEHAAALFHQRNIAINWFLLLGAPGETEETLKETFATISRVALEWDLVSISIGVRIYNGSLMASEYQKMPEDHFLRPVNFEPAGLSLRRIKDLTTLASFEHANFFMYDEDETTSLIVLQIGVKILKILRLEMPVWKIFILLRKIETFFGVRKIKCRLWRARHAGYQTRGGNKC